MLCKCLFYTYSTLNVRTQIYLLRIKDVITKAFQLAVRRFIVNNTKYTKATLQPQKYPVKVIYTGEVLETICSVNQYTKMCTFDEPYTETYSDV